MNVIICGAGEVGTHAAEVLTGNGHDVTVIDTRANRLAPIDEAMDVRTARGNCANADVLREAGADDPHTAVVAATNSDEVNLLSAAVARGLGAGVVVCRVHHSAYFDQRGLDYRKHLGIDRLICPEYSTAQAIASTLRNPVALAIENFASGQIEMQEFPVTAGAPAIGKPLAELSLPDGVRLAAIRRGKEAFLPGAATRIQEGDVVILVGNVDVFQDGRRLFRREQARRQRIAVMGGTSMGVWLCRALRDRAFSIRLFETDERRAEELAEKLEWVTVLHADPTDTTVFEEERLSEADVFIGLTADDEHNILGCAWAKTSGVAQAVAVVQRPRYVQLIGRVGIDHAFSPRRVAVRQIERSISEASMFQMTTLAEGVIDVYRLRVRPDADAVGKPLRKLNLSPDWMIAAIQHEGATRVPTADDYIHAGDNVMAIGRRGAEKKLKRVFSVR